MYLKYFAFHLPMNFCFSGITMQNLNSLVSSAQQLSCCYLLIRLDVTFMRWFTACSFLLCVFFSPRSFKPVFFICLVSVPYCCCCYGVVWSFVGLWSLPFREDFTFLLTFLSARELSLTKSWAVDDAFRPVPLRDFCHIVLPITLPAFTFRVFRSWVDYAIL